MKEHVNLTGFIDDDDDDDDDNNDDDEFILWYG